MEYYSTINGNEILKHDTSLMTLENNILSERSQTQKAAQCMIPFIKKKKKTPRLEEFVQTEREEVGMGNDCFIDPGVPVIHSQPFTRLLDYLSVCMLSCLRLFAAP